jgi:hypothetical protein
MSQKGKSMENMTINLVDDTTLRIDVKLDSEIGITKGRKNVLLATSHGNVSIATTSGQVLPIRLNVSVWRPVSCAEKAQGKVLLRTPEDPLPW